MGFWEARRGLENDGAGNNQRLKIETGRMAGPAQDGNLAADEISQTIIRGHKMEIVIVRICCVLCLPAFFLGLAALVNRKK